MYFFLKGAVLGFLIAAPVGPIGLLCIARTLRSGWIAGFFSGLGAATADAFYGAVAAFGVSAVMRFLGFVSLPLHVCGALYLGYLGIAAIRSSPLTARSDERSDGAAAAYGSTVLLTVVNPATILSFVAIFSTISGASVLTSGRATALVAGVFFGSVFWWLTLATACTIARTKIGTSVRSAINAASGAVLIGFAFYTLLAP